MVEPAERKMQDNKSDKQAEIHEQRTRYALAELREAMGLIDGRAGVDMYAAYKALIRAQDYLTGELTLPAVTRHD